MTNKVNSGSISNDRRIISHKLLQGEISEKDIEALLKKLPDVSDNAEEVTLDEKEK